MSQNEKMGLSKTNDKIKIKIKIPIPSEGPPASSTAPVQDLTDVDVLCTLIFKMASQNLEQMYIKDQ